MLIIIIVFGPFVFAILGWLIGRADEKARDIFVIIVTALELFLTVLLYRALASSPGHILKYGLAFLGTSGKESLVFSTGSFLVDGLSFTADGFRCVYAVVTALMWAGTSLFSREYFKEERRNLNRYWFFVIATLGATEGVMLSGDLLTAFLFFEILSFTSFTWVIHEENEGAVRAGYTYLFVAVIGGLILFMGLALLHSCTGTLSFGALHDAVLSCRDRGKLLAAGICILLGFGAKAGMFPLHIWLPKAHPVAPSPASALLSGILTKVGIYGILMTSAYALFGNETFGLLVLVLGGITMALGALLALFSVNLKRTLACSSMSQIGFILTGAGMMLLLEAAGSEEGAFTAFSGLVLHMTNHSLIKLTLFMAAGVLVMNIHALELDEVRGYGRNKWALKAAFLAGALGISGIPLFNGYISKTLLHEGIVEGIHHCASYSALLSVMEWVFLISGGFTLAYMLKLFFCVFVEKNKDPERQKEYDREKRCMNGGSTVAVLGSSLLMPLLGCPPVILRLAYRMTGYEEILSFKAFSLENLKGGAISITIGILLYVLVVKKLLYRDGSYVDLWPKKLDLENAVYRPLLTRYLPGCLGAVAAVFGENRILKPLCRALLPAFGAVAAFFGENRILKPLCRLLMFLAAIAARALEMGTDGLIVLLRRTIFRERKVKGKKAAHPGLPKTLMAEISGAAQPLTSNFTFAMMMTCIGIVVILCAIAAAVLV